MKNGFSINIRGKGTLYEGGKMDVDVLAKEFVTRLSAAGHEIQIANVAPTEPENIAPPKPAPTVKSP